MTAKAMAWALGKTISRQGAKAQRHGKEAEEGWIASPAVDSPIISSSFAPLREKFVALGGHSVYGGIAAVIAVNWG